jgi:hypothetical protein
VVEIIGRERNVRRHALQHRDDLTIERIGFSPGNKKYADAATVAGQRQRRRRSDVPGPGTVALGQRTRVIKEIIADDQPLPAKRLTTHPGTLGRTSRGRNDDAAQAGDVVATASRETQQVGTRLQPEDRRG